jgi:hypothetical protein
LVAFWNTGFSYDLHASDRAWWPGVVTQFADGGLQGRMSLASIGPASRDLYAQSVAAACGRQLVNDTLVIVMGPSPYSQGVQHLYVLDRGGTPLVYFATY